MAIKESFSIPGFGTVFTAPPNTPLPEGGITAFTREADTVGDFDNLGHTSSENTIELSVDGGDAQSKRSWLRSNLVTIYEGITWSAAGSSIQCDKATVQKIYNGWDTADGKGSVIGATKEGINLAMVILAEDDTGNLGFYIPNQNFTFGDAPSFDVENFFELPFAASFQAPASGVLPSGPNNKPGLFAFYGPDAWDGEAPTGVTPGTPGSFVPTGAEVPATIAELRALGALDQTAAWTTGQYIEYGNAQKAYWNGTDWATGTAA
ncbi:hypothetical protein ACFWHR_03880 [Leucobacter sp. NPDC058333]|uniref:phage tail tube protein n=1 Tax=Leucobacter sp. NPDC058333 TaxID=3346450 RepID=UPI0036486FD3